MNDMHGILFAYSSNFRLKELTEHRTASSLPFGARYRVIDFMLSNMVNAGITDVGVIMRENYQSLLDHLGSGRDWDLSRKRGGLRILPPFAYALTTDNKRVSRDASPYRGKLEALQAVGAYLDHIKQEYIVLADGDLIVNLPLEEIFEQHLASGADITCVCSSKRGDGLDAEASYARLGTRGRITEVLIGAMEEGIFPLLGVYILSKKKLTDLMAENSQHHNGVHFTRDILQRMQPHLRLMSYVYDGFSTRLRSVSDYFEQSMNLLKPGVRSDLFYRGRPIKTKVRDDASTYYAPESRVKHCVVADGCVIRGSLENCVVFRGVRIDEGAVLKNCIFMQDTRIEKSVELSYAITDKEVCIREGRSLKGHEVHPIAFSKGSVV
ncbi:MAG: glucose-1-phosphate adenylyltransferase subunit GlgD [Oscillospiraceae bacterium]|jgi:glucose-1-phosphate adenylyltransferase|nr:glucose-1-phosphate adenylyltransferase subunit GlgD [Oscillospiraceae bacterium]